MMVCTPRRQAGTEGSGLAFFGKLFVALQFTGNHLSCYLRFVNSLARQHGLTQDVANRKYVQYLGAHLNADVDEATVCDGHNGFVGGDFLQLNMYATSAGQMAPPTPLNFSTKATIFWNTPCFLMRYCGFSGLIFGRTELNSVPFSLANSRFSELAI